ncbi:hypothetical protein KZZ07_21665 [Mameliella sp. CS4]|uniref:RNase A-like domain-containing protein n=1 Tax=Mameliella sp. CS4 TaxID=2862329 RepID=UPI001C5EB3DA|nr:RNase A-like domain-containing protein [Mameliella sp. CS4]MBW4985155.1 hypothetical protein [Mameliella sp. CS4]
MKAIGVFTLFVALLVMQSPAQADGTGSLGQRVKQQLHGHAGNHVSRSPSQLLAAARAQAANSRSGEGLKSSYANARIARQTTQQILTQNGARIDKWLSRSRGGPNARLTLGDGNGTRALEGLNRGQGRLGTAVTNTGRSIPAFGAKVVIQRNATSPRGYRIQNSYPTVARSFPNQLRTFRGTSAGQVRSQFGAAARVAPRTSFSNVARMPRR